MNFKRIAVLLTSIFSILTPISFCFFGFSSSSSKNNSQLLAASEYGDPNNYNHSTLITENSISYENIIGISQALYGQKGRIEPYLKTADKFSFFYNDISFNSNICTAKDYSDSEIMECLNLPLFSNESSIRYGPKKGANYAAYIPSSLADVLIDKGFFESFDEIIDENPLFSTLVDETIVSFSINNIYLNNKSENWKREEDFLNIYFSSFDRWNEGAVFAYCELHFVADIFGGYGNLEYLGNAVFSQLDGEIKILLENSSKPNSNFTIRITDKKAASQLSFLQWFLLIVSFIFSFCFFGSIFACFRKKINSRYFLIISLSLICLLIITEFLKTIFKTSWTIYLIFNNYGNVVLIVCSIVLLGLFILMSRKRGTDNDFTDEIYSITI